MSNIVYNAPPIIAEFMRSTKFVRGLMGPFGSGKSVGCVIEMLRRSLEQEPGKDGIRRSRWAIVRNSYPELRDTTRKTFEDWMPGAKEQAGWSEQEFSFTLRIRDVEAEFLFRALDRPEQVKKLLSLELTGAWINEAREVPFQVVKMLIGRLNRYPSMRDGGATWSGLIMDTNPPDDDSWWYKMFEEDRPENWGLYKQPGGRDPRAENLGHWQDLKTEECLGHYADERGAEWLALTKSATGQRVSNPAEPNTLWLRHLAASYYNDLATANASDPLWVKVHVDAQYGPTMNGKPVYPEYRDDIHSVDEEMIPKLDGAVLLVGVDFGLTPAIVMAQRDPKDEQLQVIDEMVAEDLGASRFFEDVVRYVKREYRGRPIHGTGDPGGEARSQVDERTPYDVANAQGIPLVPAHTNDFTIRRDAVGRGLTRMTLLGRPAIVVSKKCKVLRKAMNGGYALRRISAPGEQRFRDVPDKNHFSHVAEAMQYLALGEGEDTKVLEPVDRSRRGQRFKTKTAGARRQIRRA